MKPDWQEQRDQRWRYYGALGQLRFGVAAAAGLTSHPMATDEAQAQASKVLDELYTLQQLLAKRRDQQ